MYTSNFEAQSKLRVSPMDVESPGASLNGGDGDNPKPKPEEKSPGVDGGSGGTIRLVDQTSPGDDPSKRARKDITFPPNHKQLFEVWLHDTYGLDPKAEGYDQDKHWSEHSAEWIAQWLREQQQV